MGWNGKKPDPAAVRAAHEWVERNMVEDNIPLHVQYLKVLSAYARWAERELDRQERENQQFKESFLRMSHSSNEALREYARAIIMCEGGEEDEYSDTLAAQ